MNDVSKKVEKSLHISQDVIAQIVTNSVNEIEGVYGIAPVMKTPRQLWFRQENFGNIRIGLVDDVLYFPDWLQEPLPYPELSKR